MAHLERYGRDIWKEDHRIVLFWARELDERIIVKGQVWFFLVLCYDKIRSRVKEGVPPVTV